ncbi:WD40-repeat-containing domain protein [Mycena floridula]|nr:WD40-repeat-containing domain protein [Mycena floridula]
MAKTERPAKKVKLAKPVTVKQVSPAPAKVVKASTKGKEKAVELPSSFKIVAGSYEKLLYGLEGTLSVEDGDLKFHLKPLFIFPAHVSCIKAVAASPEGGKWLATGSTDEIIKVWDLRRKKEIGGLMQHEGSITHLSFPSRSHLLSASEDGTLCLFRARDWAVLRSLRGHKGHVNSVAVHPSSKVGLSVGKDRTLRMWDLMRGKGCASTKLGKEGELVRWSTDGSLFAVQCGSTVDLYNTDMTLLHAIRHPSRIHDICFCKRINGEGDVLLVAAEDKKVSIYTLSTEVEKPPTIVGELIGHENRVKAVQTLRIALPTATKSTTIVSTASSDGKLHVYDLASLPAPESSSDMVQISPVVDYDTKGTRLTCLTLADGEAINTAPTNGKRKHQDEEEEEASDDEEEFAELESEDEEEGEEEEESE